MGKGIERLIFDQDSNIAPKINILTGKIFIRRANGHGWWCGKSSVVEGVGNPEIIIPNSFILYDGCEDRYYTLDEVAVGEICRIEVGYGLAYYQKTAEFHDVLRIPITDTTKTRLNYHTVIVDLAKTYSDPNFFIEDVDEKGKEILQKSSYQGRYL